MRRCALVCLASAVVGCALASGPLAGTAAADAASSASIANVPKVVRLGLDAYKNGGPDAAVNTWMQDSVLSGSKEALDAANLLRQVRTMYGAYLGFEIISVRDITPSTRVLYLALDYDRGPVFARFVVYRAKPGWVVTDSCLIGKRTWSCRSCLKGGGSRAGAWTFMARAGQPAVPT